MDSVNKELFEEIFRDIPPVSEELAKDSFVEAHMFQGRSVVHVARSKKKIKYMSLNLCLQRPFTRGSGTVEK